MVPSPGAVRLPGAAKRPSAPAGSRYAGRVSVEPSGAQPRNGKPNRTRALNRSLFAWFRTNGRDLAFRQTRDRYAVLVSEVMLQQTQALRVEPAWRAFMSRFPTVEALAAATPAEVIRAWGNLGYNGRAVRLHRAAQAIVKRHGGVIPREPAALEALPGVGPYTARALAAIAFGRPVAAVDTNVARVAGRVFVADPSADSRAGIQRLADGWVAPTQPARWTHAVMDVGALFCRPRAPRCDVCPLRRGCDSAGALADVAVRPRHAPQPRRAPFPTTRRWLRGRIVERLRTAPPGRWVRLDGGIGGHDPHRVASAVATLASEGLVEVRSGRARLPVR